MTKVIVDKEMFFKLAELRQHLELCDEHGKTLGFFQPVPARDRWLYENVEVPISEEELQRCEEQIKQGKFYTTAEVLAHLKSLEKQ